MKIFIKEIDRLYEGFVTENRKEESFFIIKAVLLKYLMDNEYIQDEVIVDVRHDFTINAILTTWAGYSCDYYQEDPCELDDSSWKFLLEFIEKAHSLQGKSSSILGYVYEHLNSITAKKDKGMFYTPKEIILHMISLLEIPIGGTFKVIDPACGSGFFLSEIYDEIFRKHICESSEERFHLHKKILEQGIYGIEKDSVAALISRLTLSLKNPTFTFTKNIMNKDALLDDCWQIQRSYDFCIGNPPYIGHKLLGQDYFAKLKETYGDVFYDKGDLSYCFFKRGLDLLKHNGRLIYITSRYFLESQSGSGVRKYLKQNSSIEEIIDFNGHRVIKGAKVDLAIVKLKNAKKFDDFLVKKLNNELSSKEYDQIFLEASNYQTFHVKQENLQDNGWILMDSIANTILEKIRRHTSITLSEITRSYQGIITGYDKAFVISAKDRKGFHENLLKPWIKSSNIEKYAIHLGDKVLLYTDEIVDLSDYPYEKKHLMPFKERLSKRRECQSGVRQWYMLQWGRKKEIFLERKIIFPYKASHNKFAIDEQGSFFSADIYSLCLNENLLHNYNLEFLVCLLNSKLYEFYFKSYAKKLGGDLYEYYPNTLMRLQIPQVDYTTIERFTEKYKQVIQLKMLGERDKLDIILKEIDEYFYDLFHLNKEEKEKINNSIKRQL